MSIDFDRHVGEPLNVLVLWIGTVIPPLAVLGGLELAYLLVPQACRTGHLLPVHLAHLATLLLCLTGALASWRQWRRLSVRSETGPEAGSFMAQLGLLASGAFLLVSVSLWLPSFILDPCQ